MHIETSDNKRNIRGDSLNRFTCSALKIWRHACGITAPPARTTA